MLDLKNLDEAREFMLSEFKSDNSNGKLYISNRLSNTGKQDYPELFKQAISNARYGINWLAAELTKNNRLNAQEISQRNGIPYSKSVPHNANLTLAEGEFNRFYIRGLCLYAIEQKINLLIIYRAKDVDNPRIDSMQKIGQNVSPIKLLEDLRNNVGIDTALGLPAGPNSCLSVKL